MIFQASELEQVILALPKDIQLLTLYTIKHEYKRWASNELTQEEEEFQDKIKNLAKIANKTIEQSALKVLGIIK